jgi:lysophospholipase L1-like esterase
MNAQLVKKSIALTALAAICACSAPSGGFGGATVPAGGLAMHRAATAHGSGILARIVGVGDSLTAGYQAGGFLGDTNVKNPLYPGTLVRPGQENGWWADLDEMASGLPQATAIAQMYDPATSPLPLIKGPGLNNQLVPSNNPLAPLGELKSGNTCSDDNGFNAEGFLLRGLSVVRMNPSSSLIRDVGVPGITLHEANVLSEPQTNTCQPLPGIPGLLSAVTADESSVFWPVLGNYARFGNNLSEVNAAASWHPTLATVWLGGNDVLKYMGSGGRFVGGDRTEGQVEADLVQTIQMLKYSGARVVVANLPNVLQVPYFMRVTIPSNMKVCSYQTYVYCVLTDLGLGIVAATLTKALSQPYGLDTPNGCIPASTTSPCGYLTLPGALGALEYYTNPKTAGKVPNLDCSGPGFTPPCVAGSGLGGNYITPAFAAKIQALNNAVNAGIFSSATYTQSGFVDVSAIYNGLSSGDPSNAYFAQAAAINPGICCTVAFEGGLVSFDGVHPSNTGYALIAYDFIKAINARYGTHIPQIDLHQAYRGTRCSNKLYCFPDVYAPQAVGDARLVLVKGGLRMQYLRKP